MSNKKKCQERPPLSVRWGKRERRVKKTDRTYDLSKFEFAGLLVLSDNNTNTSKLATQKTKRKTRSQASKTLCVFFTNREEFLQQQHDGAASCAGSRALYRMRYSYPVLTGNSGFPPVPGPPPMNFIGYLTHRTIRTRERFEYAVLGNFDASTRGRRRT